MNWLRYLLGNDRCEPCRGKLRLDGGDIVVGRRNQRRRIAAESLTDHIRRHIEDAALPVSPDAEQKPPAGPQHAQRLAKARLLVRKEHDTELADHPIEQPVAEWQREGVRLLPSDPLHSSVRFRSIEHRRVQIGRRDGDRGRQPPRQRAGHHARAGGDLEHVAGIHFVQPFDQIQRERLEHDRDQNAVIKFWHRAVE
jgi:hypothetical protein